MRNVIVSGSKILWNNVKDFISSLFPKLYESSHIVITVDVRR